MWRTILVPHDFSACADRALELATALARIHGAEIVLLHVSSLAPNVPSDALVTPPGQSKAMKLGDYVARDARERLDAAVAAARGRGVEQVRSLTVVSSLTGIVDEILGSAIRVGADVVVAGTHGRTGLSHFLLGSIAERLVRLSPIPVITVRSEAAAEAEPTAGERLADDETMG